MPALWNREPALILAACGAILSLAVGFGLPVTPAQVALIMAAVFAVLGLVTRSQVSPAGTVVAQVNTAGVLVAGPAHPLPAGTRIKPDVPPPAE
jgi:hypothetical protein